MTQPTGGHEWTFQAVCRDLRRQIIDGALTGRMPGEARLSAQYGLSLRRVRRVFAALEGEGLVQRQRGRGALIRHLAAAAAAKAPALKRVVMVFFEEFPSYPFAQHVARGADARAHAKGLDFELRQISRGDVEHTIEQMRLDADAGAGALTGWMLMNLRTDVELLERWRAEHVLFVLVEEPRASVECNCVGYDHQKSIRDAAERLIDLGHRRIGFIGAITDSPVSQARRRGFRAALEAGGLPVTPQWCCDDTPESPLAAGVGQSRKVAIELFATDDRPTGLVAFNQRAGGEILQAAAERRIDVPAQVSVIAVGSHYAPGVPPPKLTRLDMGPPGRLGEQAVDLLSRPDATAKPLTRLLDGSWIPGSTTGPPPR